MVARNHGVLAIPRENRSPSASSRRACPRRWCSLMNAREQDKSIIVHTVDPKNAKRYLIPALIHPTRAINGPGSATDLY